VRATVDVHDFSGDEGRGLEKLQRFGDLANRGDAFDGMAKERVAASMPPLVSIGRAAGRPRIGCVTSDVEMLTTWP